MRIDEMNLNPSLQEDLGSKSSYQKDDDSLGYSTFCHLDKTLTKWANDNKQHQAAAPSEINIV
jgi:hypothetical protein